MGFFKSFLGPIVAGVATLGLSFVPGLNLVAAGAIGGALGGLVGGGGFKGVLLGAGLGALGGWVGGFGVDKLTPFVGKFLAGGLAGGWLMPMIAGLGIRMSTEQKKMEKAMKRSYGDEYNSNLASSEYFKGGTNPYESSFREIYGMREQARKDIAEIERKWGSGGVAKSEKPKSGTGTLLPPTGFGVGLFSR